MKKILLVLPLLLLLCSCQKAQPEYLISSIGFDNKDGQINTCFEAVVINSETKDQRVLLIEGKAKTVEEGIKKIKRQCTQKFLLSHCGVLIIGDTVTKEQLDNVYEYCFNERDITLSAYFVRTENAKKLLSQKPVSTIAVGYDIFGLIKQYSQSKRIKNRYFEIMAQDKNVALPKITLKKEGYYLEKH